MATKTGTNGNDVILGGAESDFLLGLAGNDQITGGEGDDVILGGDGNDRLIGQGGLDLIYGGKGNDYLDGWGIAQLSGEAGDDTLIWNPGSVLVRDNFIEENLFDGGSGTDTLIIVNNATEDYQSSSEEPPVEPAITRVSLRGNEHLGSGDEPVVMIGDFESDEGPQLWGYVYDVDVFDFRGTLTHAIFDGDNGRSTVLGTQNGDRMQGLGGVDVLEGRGGNDFLQDGEDAASNTLRGGAGNDRLDINFLPQEIATREGASRSVLDGGEGNDTLFFDTQRIGNGVDASQNTGITLYVGDPNLRGPFGRLDLDDTVTFGNPNGDLNVYADVISIENFNFSGSQENLFYRAFGDRDVGVIGTNNDSGDDFRDGVGDEKLSGLAGNDKFLLSGGGSDIVDGGSGNDVFTAGFSAQGNDFILNFEGAGISGGDRLDFRVAKSGMSISQVNGDTVFSWNGGTVTVETVGLQENLDYFFV